MWPWWASLLTGLGGVIVALIGAFLTPWMQGRLVFRRELAATYWVPFVKWTRALYEELTEFEERYIKADYNKARQVYDSLSRTLIIMDYRELHDRLREAPNYMGKIARENPEIAKYLHDLMGLVDDLWHGLQDEFRVNFDQSEHDVWVDAIIRFPRKELMVSTIRDSDLSKKLWKKFREEKGQNIQGLRTYLLDFAPKGKP